MFVSSCLHSFPAETLCIPMILSSFSHFSFLHMAANMYVLWSFSTSAISMFGREQFMAIYLSAGINLVSVSNWLPVPFTNSTVSSGVISSFVSYTCKIATGRFGPSLGAVSATLPCHHLGLWRLLQMCDLIGCFFFLSLERSWPSWLQFAPKCLRPNFPSSSSLCSPSPPPM